MNNAENVFNDLGNCLESTFNEKKTKVNVLGSIFSLGKFLAKLTINAGICAVKNTSKAVVAVASAKREIVTVIEEEVHKHNKQLKKDALDEKIKHLKLKGSVA